jgi:YVTN family beta-propeller protein
VKVDPAEPDHYFLNIALNSAAGVGYIADTNTRDVLVVRLDSGKLVDRIASPNSVAVLYNAARDEIYVTHRNDRSISVIDARTHHLKHTIKTAAMPNSLVFLRMAERFMPASNRTKKATSLTTFSRLI